MQTIPPLCRLGIVSGSILEIPHKRGNRCSSPCTVGFWWQQEGAVEQLRGRETPWVLELRESV